MGYTITEADGAGYNLTFQGLPPVWFGSYDAAERWARNLWNNETRPVLVRRADILEPAQAPATLAA